MTGVDPKELRERRGCRHRRQWRDLLRARRHRTTPGFDHRDRDRQPGDGDRQYRPSGVGVNPLRGQNNVQGSCDMGSFPHELPGYRHISGEAVRDLFEGAWNVKLQPGAGPAHSQHVRRRDRRHFMGLYVQGEDILQSDPNTKHVVGRCRRWNA